MMTTVRFERVRIKAVRRWKENGKSRQETKVFEQTINPFNRDSAGIPKSRAAIVSELQAERDQWLQRIAEATR
jgi:hypothetical protein